MYRDALAGMGLGILYGIAGVLLYTLTLPFPYSLLMEYLAETLIGYGIWRYSRAANR